MALIKCPDCGKMVSDRAQVCPDCGYPIIEEVTRIQSMAENISVQGVSSDYSFETEKEVAEKIYEELENGKAPDVNLYQAILYKLNPESEYLTIISESRDFSNVEDEQNEYIKENLYLMLNYLDYPLDENGFRNYFEKRGEYKKKGFFQTTPYPYTKKQKTNGKKEKYNNDFDRFVNVNIEMLKSSEVKM